VVDTHAPHSSTISLRRDALASLTDRESYPSHARCQRCTGTASRKRVHARPRSIVQRRAYPERDQLTGSEAETPDRVEAGGQPGVVHGCRMLRATAISLEVTCAVDLSGAEVGDCGRRRTVPAPSACDSEGPGGASCGTRAAVSLLRGSSTTGGLTATAARARSNRGPRRVGRERAVNGDR
jgi:hypothetical protein